jgi:DHA1 family bicyclomycin/chloramphenicol resistance-like MFS transporter
MTSPVSTLWRAPRWTLAAMLATMGVLGPFSIDTFIPAFAGIEATLGATPLQMQQTLSAYLFGFAFMNLFHGSLADSFGRRPVVMWGVALFVVASAGCAMSTSIATLVFFRALQGMTAGASLVVSRALIRDMFPPAEAQRMMSQVTIYFGIAPAIAPVVGGLLYVHAGWHSIFWFLTVISLALWLLMWRLLPETLTAANRQPFNVRHLFKGYVQLSTSREFLLLALASGLPFNGLFLYVLAAPVFLGEHLHLAPTQFFWFFIASVSGIILGAWSSGFLAGRIKPKHQIRNGLVIMVSMSVVNILYSMFFTPSVPFALVPMTFFAYGWALMTPVVTLMALDVVPERRGMAASLQAFIGGAANGLVAGAIVPLVMHSTVALSLTSGLMVSVGVAAWLWVKRKVT